MKKNNSLTVEQFLDFSRNEVLNLTKIDYPVIADTMDINGTFIVWSARILGNMKCMVSTMYDNKYYEFTYNISKNEIYIDTYNKERNYVAKFDDKLSRVE